MLKICISACISLRWKKNENDTTIRSCSPARIALCAWNSHTISPFSSKTASVTSLNFWFSNRSPRSSGSRHSGTLNCIVLLWPEMLTLSATTLTWRIRKEKLERHYSTRQTRVARTISMTIDIQRYIPRRISWVYRPVTIRWLHPRESLSWWISWSPNLYLGRTCKHVGSLQGQTERKALV